LESIPFPPLIGKSSFLLIVFFKFLILSLLFLSDCSLMADLGEQQVVLDFSHWKSSVISAFPKHVKDKYDAIQVPGHSALVSGFSVVVVVVVVVGGTVGTGGLPNGFGFLDGGGLLLPPPPPPRSPPKRAGPKALTSPPSPPPGAAGAGEFDTLGGAAPPPEFNKVPSTGSKAPIAPASLFPVAALRRAGAALKRADVKSGPPPLAGL